MDAVSRCWVCQKDKEYTCDHRQKMNDHLVEKHGLGEQQVEQAAPCEPMLTRREGWVRETVIWSVIGDKKGGSFVSSHERRDPWGQ